MFNKCTQPGRTDFQFGRIAFYSGRTDFQFGRNAFGRNAFRAKRLSGETTGYLEDVREVGRLVSFSKRPISYPESSRFLVSRWAPGETLGYWVFLPQDFCGKTMQAVTGQPTGGQPLTKKPEDSVNETFGFL